jgi:hypothetical protein
MPTFLSPTRKCWAACGWQEGTGGWGERELGQASESLKCMLVGGKLPAARCLVFIRDRTRVVCFGQ